MKKALVLGLMFLAIFTPSTVLVQAAQSTAGKVNIASTAPGTTQVTITVNTPGTYKATLNSGHCNQAGTVRYALSSVVGGSSQTTLKVSYPTVVAGDWHVALVRTDTTGTTLCGDSSNGVPMVTDIGMPGTDAPISPPFQILPATGNADQSGVVALLALALVVLTFGVFFTRRKPT